MVARGRRQFVKICSATSSSEIGTRSSASRPSGSGASGLSGAPIAATRCGSPSLQRSLSAGAITRITPRSCSAARPISGCADARIPSISAPIRSPESVLVSPAASRIAAAVTGSIVSSKREANRAARRVRSASSLKRSAALPTARKTRASRSSRPPCGSTKAPLITGSPPSSPARPNAMAFTVKSRRARSP